MKKDKKIIDAQTLDKQNKKIKTCIIIIVLLVIGIFVLTGLLAVDVYYHRRLIKYDFAVKMNEDKIENVHNARYKLKIWSAYNDLEAYHPKVINFEEEWHGYKYWMVYTPYPKGDDKKENPHLMVSNDMVNWAPPKDFKNPLVPKPSDFIAKEIYNSDPHILYNKDKDQLEVFYRYVNNKTSEVIIYRLTSNDGVNWSDKEAILTRNRKQIDFLSPAVIYEDGLYKMWFVDRDFKVRYMESEDCYNWKNLRDITLKYPSNELKSWHLDVIKTEKGYEMVVVAFYSSKDRNTMNLYYFYSRDNEEYSTGVTILRPSLTYWDNKGIYRSSLVYEDGKYYLFYSGISTNEERGVGLAYGDDIQNLIGMS